MLALLRTSLVMLGLMTLLLGVVYPFAITVLSQLAFSANANGSLVMREGSVVGSRWIGQELTSPGRFWGRPSATSARPYDAAASSGSNLGPLSPALHDAVGKRVAALRAHTPAEAPIPIDLVTSSGSGLDPNISPAAALWQVPRIAKERGLTVERVQALVESQVEPRWLGVLGEKRVNVLLLNLALDAIR